AAVFVVGSAAAVPAALWLLGVRDWRCYGAAFLWPPVLSGVAIGTISPLLLLGVAACWRLRGRGGLVAAAALTVAAKLFLLPLLVWLWVTGRRAVAVAALTAGVVG